MCVSHGLCPTGRISITLDIDWKEPLTTSAADVEAADRAIHFKLGWFAHAIIVNGDYPPVMIENIAAKSAQEGRATSRLPAFTEAEKVFNKGIHFIYIFLLLFAENFMI